MPALRSCGRNELYAVFCFPFLAFSTPFTIGCGRAAHHGAKTLTKGRLYRAGQTCSMPLVHGMHEEKDGPSWWAGLP